MGSEFRYDYEHRGEHYNFSVNLLEVSNSLLTDPKKSEESADRLGAWLGKNLKKPCRVGDLDTLVWYRALELLHNGNRLN